MADYLKEFKNPSAKFRGAPFWAWNCKLDKEKLVKQVDYFHEMGLGGFTMHCRTGLDTPYMSEEFLSMISACVERAKELDMKAYLYDEDRWPSGFAGGMVTKEEKYRARCLVFTTVNGKGRKAQINPEELTSHAQGKATDKGKLLASYRVILQNGCLKSYEKLTAAKEKEARKNGDTIWYAYLEVSPESPWYNNRTYVDTLNKEAIAHFIEATHEKYYQAVGADFGGVIPSIFTDEPQFVPKQKFGRADDTKDVVIPYTDDFEDTYKKEYKESFLDHLPEVFWELPEGKVSVTRYQYHDHLTERFANAYADTIGEWCEKHHIALTGHMMSEPALGSQTMFLGEAMRHYRGFQVPGIDMLCDWREYTTAKQAQSAAHQLGRNEITSELYGVTNWDFDFRGHKLQGDWQAALGVTHRVHHLSWASMAGEAKRDYPASIFYQSPWYRKYRIVEDYFARVNTALMSGSPKVRIGVIHPVESFWISFGPDEQTAATREELEKQFKSITEWLLFGLQDFDYISEGLLLSLKDENAGEAAPEENAAKKAGRIKAGETFKAGKMDYDMIIIPGCRTLRSTTVDKLTEFAKNGGRIIVMGRMPEFIDAKPAALPDALRNRIEQIAFDQVKLMEALEPVRMVEVKTERGIRTNQYLYQMRELGGDAVLFLANGKTDPKKDTPKAETYTISIAGRYYVTVLDAMTGEQYEIPAEYQNGRTVITKQLYWQDSLLLYLKKRTRSRKKEPEAVKEAKLETVCTLHMPIDYEMSEPNVLLLDQAEYSLDGEPYAPSEEVLRIDNILRTRLGWPLKMEAFAQPWTVDEEEKAEHRISLRYRFEASRKFSEVKLAMEYPEESEVVLNGQSVPVVYKGYFTDECIRTMKLPKLKEGRNELTITFPYTRKSNLEWSYLLGTFGVRVSGNKARLVKKPETPGFSDLTAQGFPFYAGNMTYVCEVDVSEGDYVLETTKYRAPLVTVSVDGGEEIPSVFAPYQADLGHLSEGKHVIRITAYGSRINAFGQVHLSDETLTWFGPGAWRTKDASFSYEYQLKRVGVLAGPILKRKVVEE